MSDKKIFIIFILLIFPIILFSYPQGWSKDTLIYKQGSSPLLFSTEKFLGITFLVEKTNETSIFIKLSRDKSKTWTKPRLLVKKLGKKFEHVSCSAVNHDYFLTWGEDDGYIYFLHHSIISNKQIRKIKIPNIEPFACLPRIYLDNNKNIHIFYHREDNEIFILYHIVSFDKGRSWSKSHKIVENITTQIKGLFFPNVVSWGDLIFIIWQNRQGGGGEGDERIDDELYFSFSKDLGQTWAYPHRLTNNKENDSRPFLILGPDFATLYLVWENNKQGDWDIYILEGKIIDEDTIAWDPEKVARVVSDTSSDSLDGSAVLKDNNLHIFWYDYREGKSQLFTRILNTTNKNFSDEIQLTRTKQHSKMASVILSSNVIYLTWEKRVENYSEIYLKHEDTEIDTPLLYSTTHISNVWSTKKTVIIHAKKIKDESGIKGYSYIIDRAPDTVPDIINYLQPDFKVELKDIEDGIHYLHTRVVDNNDNWSKTAHYKVKIDTSGPEITDISFQQHKGTLGKYNVKFSWDSKDFNDITGYAYKLSKEITTFLPEKIMIRTNIITINNVPDGIWFLQIHGIDKLRNWGKINVFRFILKGDDIPPSAPVITSHTHQMDEISMNNSPEFKVSSEDNTGIKGFNYIVTRQSNYILKNKFRTSRTNIKITKLRDGKWYFMVKSVDYNGNWSDKSVFYFIIDHTPPQIKYISHKFILNINIGTNNFIVTNITMENDTPQTNITEQTKITTNTNISVIFSWNLKEEEEKVGYSFSFSTNKFIEPPGKVISVLNETKSDILINRNYYFKLKARDRLGNWSRTLLKRIYFKKVIIVMKKKKPVKKTSITGADLFVYDDILHYKVKKRDIISDIVRKILLTSITRNFINSLSEYNYIENPDMIFVGDIIRFPLLKIKDTIVIEKIKPSFFELIKNRILLVIRKGDGIKIIKVKDLSKLKKDDLIIIKINLFLKTGRFYFY